MDVRSGERTMLLRAASAESSTLLRQASMDSPLFRRNIFLPAAGPSHGPLMTLTLTASAGVLYSPRSMASSDI